MNKQDTANVEELHAVATRAIREVREANDRLRPQAEAYEVIRAIAFGMAPRDFGSGAGIDPIWQLDRIKNELLPKDKEAFPGAFHEA